MSVEYKDYYKLLGVDRSSPKEEIAKSYKKLAKKCHPDLNPDNKDAENKFKEINEAYEVLKDDEKRKLYDQLGANWQHGQQFQGGGYENIFNQFGGSRGGSQSFDASGFSDFFEVLFGQAASGGRQKGGFSADPFSSFSKRSSKSSDVEASLELSLEEVYNGGKKNVSLDTANGRRTLEVNIPIGVKDGAKLRLTGQAGNANQSGQAGDLYLIIKLLPHNFFSLDGDNILCDLDLSPTEAMFGTKAKVNTLSGQVEMNIPAGTNSGKKMRIKGRGLGVGDKKGDQFIKINIKLPDLNNLSPKEKELWQELHNLGKSEQQA